ncbi:MAG TPA: cysteine--tRNA ligase [Gaiellaceae bacterium]|nr:cysteine--tRNA ligase [Gaiellaceae bacterium]HEX4747868.1 cysteine--tRNA ligase [Gaiellaceae bacterium]
MRLYDTLTRSLVELPPPPGPIRMYVCGSTVYQRIHVGNSRPFVLGMWLRSWLRATGYDVTLVHNITDVDDKVYAEAARQGRPSREVSEEATKWFFEDTDDLGLGRPDIEPRATETIPEIVDFIGELIARGRAYESAGDVYFSVAHAPEYGRLSGARLDEMISQESSELKRDQRDFALWKGQKEHEDAAWDSPWGPGRPGWHIECSAMAEKYLGPEFEVHGGGLDLRFPHHENELAQSNALGHRFAHVWMHNGMLELDAEKMSKSLGNVVTLRNVLDTWGRETLLVFHLTGHWTKPVDFSDETMEAAAARAEGFREVFRGAHAPAAPGAWERFAAALDDDFSTPAALAVMHEWRDHELLRRALGVFGLESLGEEERAPADVIALAERRIEARRARDFDEADRLRAEIEAAGWDVRDEADGFRLVPRR